MALNVWVHRTGGNIDAVFRRPQPNYATERLPNDHSEVVAFYGAQEAKFKRNPHLTTTNPLSGDDYAAGFVQGHLWINTSTPALFFCTGDGVWTQA